jgi:hypothetical protein
MGHVYTRVPFIRDKRHTSISLWICSNCSSLPAIVTVRHLLVPLACTQKCLWPHGAAGEGGGAERIGGAIYANLPTNSLFSLISVYYMKRTRSLAKVIDFAFTAKIKIKLSRWKLEVSHSIEFPFKCCRTLLAKCFQCVLMTMHIWMQQARCWQPGVSGGVSGVFAGARSLGRRI